MKASNEGFITAESQRHKHLASFKFVLSFQLPYNLAVSYNICRSNIILKAAAVASDYFKTDQSTPKMW